MFASLASAHRLTLLLYICGLNYLSCSPAPQLSALFSLGHLPTLDEELSHAVTSRMQQAGRPDYNFKR
jgi:hypothetical protein